MNKIKKTILTLVALLAVTTGAWATEFTSLKEGDVLHLGDAINSTTTYQVSTGGNLNPNNMPYTLVRANISTKNITESETGAYYLLRSALGTYNGVIKSPQGNNGGYWQVTDTSDGISVTAVNGSNVTFAVHEGASGTTVDIAWNAEAKTGSFTMPGGNVTLEPEYYPQATLAFKGLTAAEDAAAKTEAPLAVVADGAVTGGTLMYYVATDKNFSQADAIALAETEWSAAIPTAETVEAAGTCYVWYYIKGDAEHSDTDPVPLAVTLLPEPTYAVTFADDTAEPTLWTADPAAGVKKGQTVTVTYTGTKKVIGVKAEKKAAANAAANVVTGTVNVETLKVGDIIRNATGATGNVNAITLKVGRYKMGGSEMETGYSLSVSQFNDFDADGYTIKAAWGNFTPVDENGQDGNAWIVLDFDSNGPVIGGYTVEPTN